MERDLLTQGPQQLGQLTALYLPALFPVCSREQEVANDGHGDHVSKKAKLLHAQQSGGPDLCLDLDFEGMMTESELKHLCNQLGYSYSANGKVLRGVAVSRGLTVREILLSRRQVPRPCHLHLVGFKGAVKAVAERQITGEAFIELGWP